MSLDPRAKRLLDMMALAAPQEGSTMSIEARREGFAKLMEIGAKPVAVATVRDLEIPASGYRLRLRLRCHCRTDRACARPHLPAWWRMGRGKHRNP